MTRKNSQVRIDDARNSPEHRRFIVEAMVTMWVEGVRENGYPSRGDLIGEEISTAVVTLHNRTVGLVSAMTSMPADTDPRVEVETIYLAPRWRGRGLSREVLVQVQQKSPHPVALRGPVHPALQRSARSMEIQCLDDDMTSEEFQLMESQGRSEAKRLLRVSCGHGGDGCYPCFERQARRNYAPLVEKHLVRQERMRSEFRDAHKMMAKFAEEYGLSEADMENMREQFIDLDPAVIAEAKDPRLAIVHAALRGQRERGTLPSFSRPSSAD